MRDLFEEGVGGMDRIIEAGPVKIDNPFVEAVAGVAIAAGILYASYKILSDKSAADNVATVFGKKAEKE